jgi:hypothetical protein
MDKVGLWALCREVEKLQRKYKVLNRHKLYARLQKEDLEGAKTLERYFSAMGVPKDEW